MQAFKQEETGRLSVYKQNGSLMEHFEGITDPAVRGHGRKPQVRSGAQRFRATGGQGTDQYPG